jgi:hypothetical protein
MELVATDSHCSAQVKAPVEQSYCLSFSALVGFLFTNQDLNLVGQKTADGRRTPRRDDLGLLDSLTVEPDG